jgi:hypothetical protein
MYCRQHNVTLEMLDLLPTIDRIKLIDFFYFIQITHATNQRTNERIIYKMSCLQCGRIGHQIHMCPYTDEENIWDVEILGHSDSTQWIVEPLLLCLETAEELKEQIFCSICLDNHTKIETVTTNCGHNFCKNCMCENLDHHITANRRPTCPMCRTNVRTLEIKDADFYDELYERYVTVPLSTVREDMPEDIDTVSDIAFLDSFDFMPEGVF